MINTFVRKDHTESSVSMSAIGTSVYTILSIA